MQIAHRAIDGALELLPWRMDSPAARAMLIAIGLQESRFEHRQQIQGPARGFWQFEPAGIRGVLFHPGTGQIIEQLARAQKYKTVSAATMYEAVEHNDVLAAAFARLLLWTLPRRLPSGPSESDEAWQQYRDTWRPGRPHRGTWDAFYGRAWRAVEPI